MRIEHLALWVSDLEKMKAFYLKYFELESNKKYFNPKKDFSSYFLSFAHGARIELMHRPDIASILAEAHPKLGLAHFAISLGSKEKVDILTETIRKDGYTVVGAPRTTGDGYYESVISDPEGNLIEITV
ncbi:VOC family protein [Sediminicola luteus]|uniref:Glyoxalase/bleomycin resistance/extradiol dioxygenase family protein n=1 Tax=Sediminicola luteus TaxID=319238 RepID=A0A2A4G652_9FLAO|nr:VOC family protein [Sediminicola luteus]PCE63913.1 glyoxalase/bleomycin resistance/extradiol dioxygenase family protein [Sediminicola luteus]